MPAFEEHKTIKGCTCALWKTYDDDKDDTGNDDVAGGSACGRDQGNGPWCFVTDTACEGNHWGYCAGVKVMALQDAAVTVTSPANTFPGRTVPCDCLGEGTVCETRGKSAKRPPLCRCAPNRVGAKCEFCASGYIGPKCLPMSAVARASAPTAAAASLPHHHRLLLILLVLFFFIWCVGFKLGCCSVLLPHDWRYRLPWVKDDRLPGL